MIIGECVLIQQIKPVEMRFTSFSVNSNSEIVPNDLAAEGQGECVYPASVVLVDQGGRYLVQGASVILNLAIIQCRLFAHNNFIYPRTENRMAADGVEFFHDACLTPFPQDHKQSRRTNNILLACVMNMKNQNRFIKDGIGGHVYKNSILPKGSIKGGEGVGFEVNQFAKIVPNQH